MIEVGEQQEYLRRGWWCSDNRDYWPRSTVVKVTVHATEVGETAYNWKSMGVGKRSMINSRAKDAIRLACIPVSRDDAVIITISPNPLYSVARMDSEILRSKMRVVA